MAVGLAVLPLAPVSIPGPAGRPSRSSSPASSCSPPGRGFTAPRASVCSAASPRQESQGSTIGLSRSFGALARILGPAAGTLIFATAGAGWPFWTAAALMLVAFAIAVKVLRHAPRTTRGFPPCGRTTSTTTCRRRASPSSRRRAARAACWCSTARAPERHARIADLPRLLRPTDLLVLNDTRVIPARLFGRSAGGGRRWRSSSSRKLGSANGRRW